MFQSKQVLDVSSSATGPVSDFRSLGILLRHTFRKASNDAVGTRDGQVFCRAADLPRILSSLDISLDREDVEFLAWRCLEIHARGKSKAESLDWIAPYTSAARRTDRGGNNTKGGPPSSAKSAEPHATTEAIRGQTLLRRLCRISWLVLAHPYGVYVSLFPLAFDL
jgi:hypothetical protein